MLCYRADETVAHSTSARWSQTMAFSQYYPVTSNNCLCPLTFPRSGKNLEEMHLDWIAAGIIGGVAIFSLIMFVVIRRQSYSSEHPEALQSNSSDPTLLCHAPDGSQSEYSASLSSLNLAKKSSLAELSNKAGQDQEEPHFKRRLFYEDTADDNQSTPRRPSQVV